VNSIGTLKDKNILFLQGPVGLFFKKLSIQFRNKGANTYRIGLNAGDACFSTSYNYFPYKGKPEGWETFISDFLIAHQIDKIFLFGDCRFYQGIAIAMADTLGIDVFVFEEGYLRPYYITLEKHGVNDYSRLSREAAFYRNLPEVSLPKPINATPNGIFNWTIVITYYFVAKALHFRYPHYRHHRNFSAIQEFFFGTRSLIRKIFYTRRDKKYLPLIQDTLSEKYFFVPLQTHNDFQILQHSEYGTIEKFIIEVLESFAQNTKDEYIIFKHHPIDRGRKNYTEFIKEQAGYLSVENRVLIVHDLHLPTLLDHAKGTITINSTVGLSSVLHKTATITLGKAIYDIEGLTNKDMSLNDFWTQHNKPDDALAQKFRQHLILTTQLNGSFYGRMPTELL